MIHSTLARKPNMKPRTCKNKACRNKFEPDPRHPFVIACCEGCRIILAMQNIKKAEAARERKAKREAKAERMADRKRKEELMPLKDQKKLTEKVINYYVRLRDYYEGCCSCDKPSHWDGQWHASHYKSVGSNSLLRFHLWNIHKSCSECNRHKSGNIGEYTERIRLRFGQGRVQWLDDRKCGSREYTAEYLIRMRRIFSKKCRRLEKRLGIC